MIDFHKPVLLVLGSLWETSDRLGGVNTTKFGQHLLNLLVEGLRLPQHVLKPGLPVLALTKQSVPLGVQLQSGRLLS